MERITHAPEQIIRKLKTAELLVVQSNRVGEVCRIIEGTQAANHT
jgi:hypothetical protein